MDCSPPGSFAQKTPVKHFKKIITTCHAAAAAAKFLQSCPTLCNLIDGSPPGSPVPGILQARTLEWVAISFSSGWKWKMKVKSLSHVRLLANPWTAAYQLPPSKGFSRQGYWSGLPLPSLSVYSEGSAILLWSTWWEFKSIFIHYAGHPGSVQLENSCWDLTENKIQ